MTELIGLKLSYWRIFVFNTAFILKIRHNAYICQIFFECRYQVNSPLC